MTRTQVGIPTLVRIKPGALDRLGIYLQRVEFTRPWLLCSEGLPAAIVERARASLAEHGIAPADERAISEASFENAQRLLEQVPRRCQVVVGLGGGRALDTAKYVAHLAGMPFLAVPTSLSNDGFCSPSASLTLGGRRRSLPARMPYGVVVDVAVCLQAPRALWHSGIGDLVAKLTAVVDWKLAFHARGTPVNDFAALLSDATVHQFLARPEHDEEGAILLATALMLNGVAIGVAGSSRPASGSEHQISHALDRLHPEPRLHGLQVGVASYLCAHLQEQNVEAIAELFDRTGFWDTIAQRPYSRKVWLQAVELAPSIKDDFYSILSIGDPRTSIQQLIDEDPRLQTCFLA